jgi:hypothetical protein
MVFIGVVFGVLLYFVRDIWLAVSGYVVLYSIFQYTQRSATKKTESKLQELREKGLQVEQTVSRFI